MFNKFPVLKKFLFLESFLFVILAIVSIFVSNIIIQNSFIDRSKETITNVVQLEAEDLKPEDFSLRDSDHAKKVFVDFYEKIKTPNLIRIKVWDYSGKVIFSDDESIVGQRFPDNGEFKEAIGGTVVTEIGQKMKPENVSEQGYEQLLEVYVPIAFKNESIPSGVIEAYFRLDEVNSRIKEVQSILVATVTAFTFASLGLLFVVFKVVVYKQMEKISLQAVALDNASDNVIITDPNGIVLYVNKAAERLTGYSESEMVGNRPSLWGRQMPKEFYEQMWKVIKTDKKVFKGKITNRRKNGETYVAETKISPVLDKNGEIIFFIGIERDISRETEIDRVKTEFVSLAGHQLRTPLSAVSWYTEMLLAGDAGEINEEQKKYLEEAYSGSRRMTDLVNSLLNTSRLELGTFLVERKSIDLTALVKEVVAEQRPGINGRKLILKEIYAENLPKIETDPKLIRIVFQNLLSNAIKYTLDGGVIALMIEYENDKLLVSVTDTGVGIPKNQQNRIFTKLFRADNVRGMDTEGTGLGLYIAKQVVEHLNGKIWFESEQDKGSTFYVTLPLGK